MKRKVDVNQNDLNSNKRDLQKVNPVAILITIHQLKKKVEAGIVSEDHYRTAIKVAMRKLLKTYDQLKKKNWKNDSEEPLPADATVTHTDDKHVNLVLKADVVPPKPNEQPQQAQNKAPNKKPGVLMTSVTAVNKKQT
jgi:hypothetical protein